MKGLGARGARKQGAPEGPLLARHPRIRRAPRAGEEQGQTESYSGIAKTHDSLDASLWERSKRLSLTTRFSDLGGSVDAPTPVPALLPALASLSVGSSVLPSPPPPLPFMLHPSSDSTPPLHGEASCPYRPLRPYGVGSTLPTPTACRGSCLPCPRPLAPLPLNETTGPKDFRIELHRQPPTLTPAQHGGYLPWPGACWISPP